MTNAQIPCKKHKLMLECYEAMRSVLSFYDEDHIQKGMIRCKQDWALASFKK